MELVYLWVEDYKNIKKQGFNFSPRFECSYDEDSKELTIDGNNDYVSIFPDNINITAIVGENGSGKSGLIKFLAQYSSLFFNNKLDYFIMQPSVYLIIYYDKELKQIYIIWSTLDTIKVINNTKYNTQCKILDSLKSKEYITLLKQKDYDSIPNLSIQKRVNDKFNKNCFNETIAKLKTNSFTLHYDYSFDMFTNYQNDNSVILSVPNKEYDIYQHHTYDKTLIIEHIINKNYIDNNKYFEPYKISIEPLNNIVSQFQLKDNLKIKDFILYLVNSCIFNLLKNKHRNINKDNIDIINEPIKLAQFIKENLQGIKQSFIETTMKEVPLSYELKDLINYLEILQNQHIDNIFKIDTTLDNINIDINNINKDNIILLTTLPSKFFKLKIKSINNIDYDDLSNGEKSVLRIRFYIENIVQKNKKNNYFILLDEADNELHPQWQKKLVNYLFEIFKERKETFHFIITSHSPFILSDLPKENVIFLKEGKQVDIDINPFGANIHTLLSNGFFMEDGLIGEFAKGKIEEIKKFYDENKKLKKEDTNFQIQKSDYKLKVDNFKYIQSIIGEPFLQTVIKNYLDELDILFYGKNQFLDNEIKKLQFLKDT